MSYAWHDLVGNIGVALILATYLLLQLGRMQSTDLAYSLLNGLGAALILVSLTQAFNLSSFVIEICWMLISALGVANALKARRRCHDD